MRIESRRPSESSFSVADSPAERRARRSNRRARPPVQPRLAQPDGPCGTATSCSSPMVTTFCAAPGDDFYYLNAIAGDHHSIAASDDPALAWVRETWTRRQGLARAASDGMKHLRPSRGQRPRAGTRARLSDADASSERSLEGSRPAGQEPISPAEKAFAPRASLVVGDPGLHQAEADIRGVRG